MNQVRSLWTKPERWRHPGAEELWAWSTLRLVKFYGTVTIHTDELGAIWLNALRLPVAGRINIVRSLDALDNDDPWLWSLGKLYTASIQTEPFIATDGDVILGRRLPERIHNADVCAERLYSNLPGQWFAGAVAPKKWHEDWRSNNGISFNCGLYGGRDTTSIRRIANAGLGFARNNAALLRTVKDPKGNPRSDLAAIACEEWAIAREFDPMEVSCLSSMDAAGGEMLAHAKAYWHQPGRTKIEPEVQARVREKLEAECPGQISRCREVARQFSHRRTKID